MEAYLIWYRIGTLVCACAIILQAVFFGYVTSGRTRRIDVAQVMGQTAFSVFMALSLWVSRGDPTLPVTEEGATLRCITGLLAIISTGIMWYQTYNMTPHYSESELVSLLMLNRKVALEVARQEQEMLNAEIAARVETSTRRLSQFVVAPHETPTEDEVFDG